MGRSSNVKVKHMARNYANFAQGLKLKQSVLLLEGLTSTLFPATINSLVLGSRFSM
jgi:hypothetical protein